MYGPGVTLNSASDYRANGLNGLSLLQTWIRVRLVPLGVLVELT